MDFDNASSSTLDEYSIFFIHEAAHTYTMLTGMIDDINKFTVNKDFYNIDPVKKQGRHLQ